MSLRSIRKGETQFSKSQRTCLGVKHLLEQQEIIYAREMKCCQHTALSLDMQVFYNLKIVGVA